MFSYHVTFPGEKWTSVCPHPWESESTDDAKATVSLKDHPGGSGSSVLLHPRSSMLVNNPASRVSSLWPCKFWLLPKGNLSSFFFIINSQTVRQLWQSSHSAHTGHTTFLELKHTTTSWRMDLSVTIRSWQSLQKSFQPAAGQS